MRLINFADEKHVDYLSLTFEKCHFQVKALEQTTRLSPKSDARSARLIKLSPWPDIRIWSKTRTRRLLNQGAPALQFKKSMLHEYSCPDARERAEPVFSPPPDSLTKHTRAC